MNIIEGNKLIAEFMGLNSIVENNGVVYKDNNTNEIFELKYHSSWDWLMPVVEKIEKIGFCVNITGISCSVNRILEEEKIICFVCGDISKKLELVYLVVVEFIRWYNSTNK